MRKIFTLILFLLTGFANTQTVKNSDVVLEPWTYSQNFHQQTTIERLASEFMDALQSLIAHCRSPEAGGYTPSDFPGVALSQEQLDQVLAEIDEEIS